MVKADDYEFVEVSEMSQPRSKSYDPRRPSYPYRGPINRPCSACSAGDTKMEYHDHDYVDLAERRERRQVSSLKSYTLDDLEQLGKDYRDTSGLTEDDRVISILVLSRFLAWARKREREVGE